jgi:hypothetical protein
VSATAIVAVTAVFVWFVTYGTWRLFQAEDENSSFADRFFPAQTSALLRGRLDVPKEAIEFEAFVHEGKYYGYFGVATSLLRLPLVLTFPGTEERWNRVLFTAACILNLVCAYLLLRVARRQFRFDREPGPAEQALYALFLVVVGLGSANIYLGSRSFLYHEPILWGATFALLFYSTFLRYLETRRTRTLAAAGLFSVFTFLTRAPQGAGTVLVLALFAAGSLAGAIFSGRSPARHIGDARRARPSGQGSALLAAGAALVAVAAYFAVNYAKFGMLSGMPMHLYARYQVFNEQETYERIQGKPFHLSNARTMLVNYFAPTKIRFDRHFPWAYVTDDASVFREARLDLWGEFSSLTASQPALLVLAGFGVYGVFFSASRGARRFRLPLVGAAAAAALNFFFTALSERYLHDFFPLLVLAGAAGVHQMLKLPRAGFRAVVLALVPLALYSVFVNTAFALVHQREILPRAGYGNAWSEEKAQEFQRWRAAIDRVLLGSSD